MNILLVHNSYQQRGGEDQVFESEAGLLQANGHQVTRYHVSNDQISSGSLNLAAGAIWNREHHRNVCSYIRSAAPQVVHVHNTFPLISPAVYYAARTYGIPVVQTLHNYRLLCPGGTLFRSGRICESCLGSSVPWRGVIHRCYRHSVAASATVSAMLTVHNLAGTWTSAVDRYIVLSEFARQQFIRGGFPEERLSVKPNFVDPDPGFASASDNGSCAGQIVVKPNPILPDPAPGAGSGCYALFVGRLTEEKGIRTLAAAWQSFPNVPLLVAGDGPLAGIAWPAGVKPLGARTREEVLDLMKGARALIFPSVWYEGQPLTILEALACGLAVIGSNLGAVGELIDHGRTGLLFRPGDAKDLARQVRWAFEHPEHMTAMGVAARKEFEEKYTAERNYNMLMDIYDMALENARRRRRATS
jgi:glycosyltransferase involved in cell wall biosynthesis